jgi:hypothetical protein
MPPRETKYFGNVSSVVVLEFLEIDARCTVIRLLRESKRAREEREREERARTRVRERTGCRSVFRGRWRRLWCRRNTPRRIHSHESEHEMMRSEMMRHSMSHEHYQLCQMRLSMGWEA